MKTILIAVAALCFTASAAFAECAYHTSHNATADEQKPASATQ